MNEAFQRLARYNRWMNERLHDQAARLSDAERRTDRGAFFKSIHGTLNHLILGDRLWITHWSKLQHLFNHQTHHRGQLTTLLMQAGIDPGVTDIVAMPADA